MGKLDGLFDRTVLLISTSLKSQQKCVTLKWLVGIDMFITEETN